MKGYESLTTSQQKLFSETYKLHNSMVGTDYKKEWKPVIVGWVKDQEDEKNSYLKVVFSNGEWLHYTQKKEWY